MWAEERAEEVVERVVRQQRGRDQVKRALDQHDGGVHRRGVRGGATRATTAARAAGGVAVGRHVLHLPADECGGAPEREERRPHVERAEQLLQLRRHPPQLAPSRRPHLRPVGGVGRARRGLGFVVAGGLCAAVARGKVDARLARGEQEGRRPQHAQRRGKRELLDAHERLGRRRALGGAQPVGHNGLVVREELRGRTVAPARLQVRELVGGVRVTREDGHALQRRAGGAERAAQRVVQLRQVARAHDHRAHRLRRQLFAEGHHAAHPTLEECGKPNTPGERVRRPVVNEEHRTVQLRAQLREARSPQVRERSTRHVR